MTSVSGSSFTVADAVSGLTAVYLTDPNTAFNGLSLRTMPNLLVCIHSTTRVDGRLLAQEVTVAGSGFGAVVTGVITDYAGTKVTRQQVYGPGASASVLGTSGTVTMDATSSFEVDSRDMDLTGLSLTFGPANMVPGQRIQFLSRSAITGTNLTHTLTARLQLQSISGTVSHIAVASNGGMSFDLLLPANDGSALTTLGEGTGIVHVVTQPLTKSSISLSEGRPIKVRGLLLFDAPPQGMRTDSIRPDVAVPTDVSDYYMVARSIQRDGGH